MREIALSCAARHQPEPGDAGLDHAAGDAHMPPDAGDHEKTMNRVYRQQRHIYDLTRKYFLLGRDTLIAELHPPSGGSILEIGCGTGRNLITAARAYPDARLFGLDISSAMLATARANIRHAGLESRIALALGDAAHFNAKALFGRGDFDRVFFSYSLSMIPTWRAALQQGLTVVSLSGRLFVVDFGQQQRLPAWFKRLLLAWLSRFHVEPRAELHAALCELAAAAPGELTFHQLYRDYARFAELAR
jgi:S-adenosylmethionine-diacylgycerolhomoserine-N-methlytransferase